MNNQFKNDKRIVLTLDAGGTNFVFSAIQGDKEIVTPYTSPAFADNLEKCMNAVVEGFEKVSEQIDGEISAISFAFPGPADYEKGIIGDLPNFKAFKDGIALGPMLEEKFKLPVFINNDGSLFAYGEALSGFLPELNTKIKATGGIKEYKNLIGLTLGTGFGGGIVLNNTLVVGDSSCGAEVHNTLNKFNINWNAEESISTRAIQRVYSEKSNQPFSTDLMPKDVFDIAKGQKEGNKNAALTAFTEFGEALGSSIANILTLLDGIVVIGGGITAAWELFAPSMFREINRSYENFEGDSSSRLSFKVYNLEDSKTFEEFAIGGMKEISIPGTDKKIAYDPVPRTGVGFSKIGASNAIALGAYTFALQQLDS